MLSVHESSMHLLVSKEPRYSIPIDSYLLLYVRPLPGCRIIRTRNGEESAQRCAQFAEPSSHPSLHSGASCFHSFLLVLRKQ